MIWCDLALLSCVCVVVSCVGVACARDLCKRKEENQHRTNRGWNKKKKNTEVRPVSLCFVLRRMTSPFHAVLYLLERDDIRNSDETRFLLVLAAARFYFPLEHFPLISYL